MVDDSEDPFDILRDADPALIPLMRRMDICCQLFAFTWAQRRNMRLIWGSCATRVTNFALESGLEVALRHLFDSISWQGMISP